LELRQVPAGQGRQGDQVLQQQGDAGGSGAARGDRRCARQEVVRVRRYTGKTWARGPTPTETRSMATETTTAPPRRKETLESAVIRFAGDSGDGMQITGSQLTNTTAMFGNDLATFPDF